MESFNWRNGIRCERSLKCDKPILNNKNEIIDGLRMAHYESRKKNEINNGYLIKRSGQNPFLTDKNYIKVIDDQEKYLMPLNSNYE